MLADGSSTFDVADNTRIGKLALQQDRNAWISALGGSNDDAGVSSSFARSPFETLMACIGQIQWIVSALWKVGDYRVNRGQNSSPYYVGRSLDLQRSRP